MSTTTALQLYAVGYIDLVSVVPPGAKLSPRSEIPDGTDPDKPDQRGKAPGKYDGNQGTWAGYNWRELKPKKAHVELWTGAGANIGLHARSFPAIDIDCMDEATTRELTRCALDVLGPAPRRIGRAPKALLVYATAQPFTRLRLHLKRGDEKALVEVLGDGQQYLVAGKHPGTMKPYEWDRPLHEFDPLDDLSLIDREAAERFLEEAAIVADILGWETHREGHGRLVDGSVMVQEALRAPSFEACEAAVRALPNTSRDFPSRDAMNEVGYAIKASVGQEGLPLFMEWASRWTDGANAPEYVQHEWDRMVPPFRIGWEWLRGKAKLLGGYDDAQDEFEATGGPAPSDDDFDAPGGPAGASPPPSGPGGSGDGPDDGPPPPRYSDFAVAQLFGNAYGGSFRYVEQLGGWMAYRKATGTWVADDTHKAESAVKKVCREQADRANNDTTLVTAQRRSVCMGLTKAGTIAAVLKVARSDRRVAGSRPENFDADPWQLNTPCGVVDLRTGLIEPHSPKLFLTKATRVAPEHGRPERWLRFLHEVLGGDQDLIDYMQAKAGYWLTGKTTEQELTFAWGPGGNGKGVFANTLANVMGDYAVRTPSTTFASTRNEAHPEALARLRGARLVLTTEVQEGLAWDEAKVKAATGGDVITARFMNQNSFDYAPQFKLLFLGNHKPRIRNLDAAMKRRIHLVPMTVTPQAINRHLEEELIAEEGGRILAWAIDGCVRWQQEGLKVPTAVRKATEEYFTEEDVIGAFLAECCDTSNHKAFEGTLDLFEAWTGWIRDQGEQPRTVTWLARQLATRPGLEKHQQSHTKLRGFLGLRLLVRPGEFEAVAQTPDKVGQSSSK